MIEAAQLDIFIPLQRTERLREWAALAREHELEVAGPGAEASFAGWLREHGHAPAGMSEEGLAVLVAVMRDYASG